MTKLSEKIKRLLWVELPQKDKSYQPDTRLTSYIFNTKEGPSKIHVRAFPDGSSMMVVNGHFLVMLNATSHMIIKMKLEGRTNDSILSTLKRNFADGSSSSIEEDIKKISDLLERLREEGAHRLAGEYAGNLFANIAELKYPFRADIQLRDPQSNKILEKTEGINFLEKLQKLGVISVRFISTNKLPETHVVSLVEKTQDMGIISGLMVKGREIINKNLLDKLLQAGIDYFEIPFFSNIRREHEEIEGTRSYDADLEGLRMILNAPDEITLIADLPIISSNIDNIEQTLKLLKRYGISNVNVSAVIIPDNQKENKGLGVALHEYEHATVVVEELAESIGIDYVFSSPIWYRKHNPTNIGGWRWKCTASENSPFITVNGDIFPCLHSKKRLGNLKDLENVENFKLPVEVLTDQPAGEADYVTLCNHCCE